MDDDYLGNKNLLEEKNLNFKLVFEIIHKVKVMTKHILIRKNAYGLNAGISLSSFHSNSPGGQKRLYFTIVDSGAYFSAFSKADGAVGRHHEKVYTHARQIVELVSQGAYAQADMLMTDFETSREKLFESLDGLYLV